MAPPIISGVPLPSSQGYLPLIWEGGSVIFGLRGPLIWEGGRGSEDRINAAGTYPLLAHQRRTFDTHGSCALFVLAGNRLKSLFQFKNGLSLRASMAWSKFESIIRGYIGILALGAVVPKDRTEAPDSPLHGRSALVGVLAKGLDGRPSPVSSPVGMAVDGHENGDFRGPENPSRVFTDAGIGQDFGLVLGCHQTGGYHIFDGPPSL